MKKNNDYPMYYETPTFKVEEVLLEQNILAGSNNLNLKDMPGEYW